MVTQPLKIAVALLTYNRKDLLLQTITSLSRVGFTLDVYDNGSTDGTREILTSLEMAGCIDGLGFNTSANHTTGHGMNRVIEMALQRQPDIVVFTADDYHYSMTWYGRLCAFWTHAPASVAIASLNVEPAYGWNQIREMVECGGVRALIRDTLPGSNWSFRASDWPAIGPIREATGGEDLEICNKLTRQGRKLAALNLSVHTGEKQSAWGNQSWHMARPLDEAAREWIGL